MSVANTISLEEQAFNTLMPFTEIECVSLGHATAFPRTLTGFRLNARKRLRSFVERGTIVVQ